MKKLRVYIDTSVFGGCFDSEFRQGSKAFFDALFIGRATPLISDTLVAEMANAPEQVQELLERVLEHDCDRLAFSSETQDLCDAYLNGGVLSRKWLDDALHVAHATVARADVIVSWNFKHIVNPVRIRGFNDINALQGYGPVVIMTPEDVAQGWQEMTDEEDQ